MQISIITASYNYAEYINETIESVINQTIQDWELIIVDDGSTDNSVNVISEYCAKDTRIKLFCHENNQNKGLAETLKLGLEKASGDWVAFLESDDIITPDYLEKKISIINKHPDVDFIFNDVEMFGDESVQSGYIGYFIKQRNILDKQKYPTKLHKKNGDLFLNLIPTFSCVMAKKSLFAKLDFNCPLKPVLDWYLWSQLMKKTMFYYIPEKLTHWRMHKQSYINALKPNYKNDFLFRYKLIFFVYTFSAIWRIPLLLLKYIKRYVFWCKKINGKYELWLLNKNVSNTLNKFISIVSGLLSTETKVKHQIKKYKYIERKLRKKAKKEKINITFMVTLASMFPAKPLADYLLTYQKENYNVRFLVVPDFRFGHRVVKKIQDECYAELIKHYEKECVIKTPIDIKEDKVKLIDFTDIMFFSVPYNASHPKYNLMNIIDSGILPAMVNYGFFRSLYDRNLIASQEYSLYWKVFIETQYNMHEFLKHQILKGRNCVLTGYCKMDNYKNQEQKKIENKKCILIAPHHSVEGGFNDTLQLSNFHKYADFFQQLPKLYPNINFIFRPHPALFLCLTFHKMWSQEKVNAYIDDMKNNPNVIFSDSSDYFEEFAQSDGIIQDCGSYLVEYFYTGKPQCYMLKSEKDIDAKFVELGKKCLEHSYIAYEKEHILNFIDNVILAEKDDKKEARNIFAKSEIMINYPNVSAQICKYFNSLFEVNK